MFCYAITAQESVRRSVAERSGLLQEAEHGFVGQGFHLFLHGLPCESELYEKVAHITQNVYISRHQGQLRSFCGLVYEAVSTWICLWFYIGVKLGLLH
jgi:hypothetical protein